MAYLKPRCFFLFLFISLTSFGQSLKDSMRLELSISHLDKLPFMNDCSSLKNVHVIIHNNSNSPQYFYEDWNSYGYYNISFEIKTKDSIYEVIRPPKLWYRNFKSHFILNPHESLVFPYLLVDTACTGKLRKNRIFENGWIGFPPISDTVEIRAIYQLCRLEDSIPYESIERLNFRPDDYIDFLDGDIESEVKKVQKPKQPAEPKKMPYIKQEIIFNEPLVSEWQTVLLY